MTNEQLAKIVDDLDNKVINLSSRLENEEKLNSSLLARIGSLENKYSIHAASVVQCYDRLKEKVEGLEMEIAHFRGIRRIPDRPSMKKA